MISLLCELVAHQQHYDFARQKITALSWESIPRQTCRARPLWGRATIFAGLARLSCKHDTVNYGQIITALITILDLIEGEYLV